MPCPPCEADSEKAQALFDDLAGFGAVDLGDETHSACVMFELRVVETVW